jgi:hypothetical protein
VVEISMSQMYDLCGNILELRAGSDAGASDGAVPGDRVLVMSQRARSAFEQAGQLESLAACVARVVAADVATIEKVGGGGIRCMLAELF